jgi:hypothetical protein
MNILTILTTAASLLPLLQGGIKGIADLLPTTYNTYPAFVTVKGHRYSVVATFTKIN